MKKLFLLCICLIILCSCDISNSDNAPTDTPTVAPKPAPQAVLGSSLKDFQAHFADGYSLQGGGESYLLEHTNMFDVNSPDYFLSIVNGKVDGVDVQSNAHNKGAACAAFIPSDKKFVSTLITDSPNSSGAMTNNEGGAITIYESKWLAKQFPASSFVDVTNLTSSDQSQSLAPPGTLTLSWIYIDDSNSSCQISIGKHIE